MRIGVNTLFYIPGEVGGSETYLRQTLRAMVEARPDVEMVLFTNVENDETLRKDMAGQKQVSFAKMNLRAMNRYARIIREQVELPGLVRKAGVDVLWSPGYTACLTTGCPQVVTIHDMQFRNHAEDMNWREWLATAFLVTVSAKKCRSVVAVSQFSRCEIVKYTGVNDRIVFVTHEGVNAAFGCVVRDIKGEVRKCLPDDRPYILSVSNTYPHKNMHSLVDAFAGIERSMQHRLVLVGNARRGEPAVAKSLSVLSDPSRVTRLSGLTMERLVPLYQGADVFVFPSLYEGFGLPVLEAMMAGVPVIAGRHGSIPEVGGSHFVDCGNSDAVSIEKAIRDVLSWTQDRRKAHTAAAREHASSFTWRQTAEGTLRVLESAIN